ncbi:hypothetical protein DPMN_075192 [Dreissena polymorpha]|uniref:Uncharacterized protein n=1 Tax=Dreissena polymorpha TaxID=45954 RepID=A0A9D3YHN5_DREPO|nr:hypothetical protein DPMN_075192 [Dreissena polymorpha]
MVAISQMTMSGLCLPYHRWRCLDHGCPIIDDHVWTLVAISQMTCLDHGCHITDNHVCTMVAISQIAMSAPWLSYHR